MPVNDNNPDTDGDGICDLNCPADRMMYYGADWSSDYDLKEPPKCTTCNFGWVYTTQDECAKCQRQKSGSFMAIKWSRETFNVCFACSWGGSVVTTLDECRQCPNRYWIPEM